MAGSVAPTVLHLPGDVHQGIWQHLFGDGSWDEAAGFLFVKHRDEGEEQVFEYIEWYAVPDDGFSVRNEYHFELTDETRAQVIKRAHDLGASLVEVHSHNGQWPAAFSPSDQLGFREFVPHVWWRLKGRPYMAIVATKRDFDGLVWITGPGEPQHLNSIVVDGQTLSPTGLSSLGEGGYEY